MPQIISTDTTWTSGQVIELTEEVQIANGATLTIEDGVVVNGNGNAIRAFGALVALDQNLDDVVFDGVKFLFGNRFDTPGNIRIEDAQIVGGQFLPPTGDASYGEFFIANSVLRDVTGFYIWYPTSDSSFTNNLFDGTQALSIGINAGITLTVENNTFIDALPPLGGISTVMVWANYGELQDISIIGNNFLGGLQTHLELQDGYDSSKLYSSGNYFQGFTSADAENAVLDSQDSLTRSSDIVLENQRSSPNLAAPDAPSLPSVSISPTNGSSNEGTSQNTSATFTVALSEPSNQTVSVNYTTLNSSAISGEDFVATSGTLSFAPGATTKTFSVEIIGDAENESDEIFRLELSDPVGAVLDLSGSVIKGYQALHTITNDDAVTNVNDDPTGAVTISGTASEGNQLTAITSTIADADGLGSFSYQWLREGTPISGASNSTYTLADDDIGEPISVRITYTDGGGTTETLTSAQTNAVTTIVPETIVLTNTADTYNGTNLPEIISTQGGDDVVTASKGDDTIDGGDGTDTVIYDGDQDSYTVTLGPSGVQVRDRRPDGNGTDTLTNIEFLEFDTGDFANFNLEQFGGATSLNEADFKGFIELYIAYFNRAPDAIGLNFWGTAYAKGTSMVEMAALFAPQDETLATYPDGTSNTEFATAVYNNVLGRTPDKAGFDFWVDMLNRSEETGVTRDQFILEVLRGVQDGSPDRDYLDIKVDVGAYFAVHKGMSDTGNASAAMLLYDGTDESIQTVKDAIDAYHLEALDPINGEFLMPLVGVLDSPFM
jgi:hypothetical protein